MVCPECNGRGESIYFVETDRDENTVTVEQRKGICRTCNGSGETAYTNAYRIRAMSDEELAEIIRKIAFEVYSCNECQTQLVELLKRPGKCDDQCGNCILEWLKQPAEGE